jgi:phage shock protein A
MTGIKVGDDRNISKDIKVAVLGTGLAMLAGDPSNGARTMGIFSRLTDIVNSNINAILDRAQDPEKIIRLIIQEMEDTLVEVRSSAVRAIAEKKELQRRVEALRRERDEWQRRAEFAITKGREDLAKGALLAKARLTETLDTMERQLAHLEDGLDRQNEDIAKLQAKLADAKARERAIVARQKSAAGRLKIRRQLYDERITDAFARFEQVERSLDELEGKVESYDLGRKKPLADELAGLEAEAGVEEELAALKKRLGNSLKPDAR